MNIELTRQEAEALLQLLSQVQIRAVAPDSVEQTTLFRDLGQKLTQSLTGGDIRNNGLASAARPRIERVRDPDPETLL